MHIGGNHNETHGYNNKYFIDHIDTSHYPSFLSTSLFSDFIQQTRMGLAPRFLVCSSLSEQSERCEAQLAVKLR